LSNKNASTRVLSESLSTPIFLFFEKRFRNNIPARKPIEASILKRSRVKISRLKTAFTCSEIVAVKGVRKVRIPREIRGLIKQVVKVVKNKDKFNQGKTGLERIKIWRMKQNIRKRMEATA
jgi:hypothetical protein